MSHFILSNRKQTFPRLKVPLDSYLELLTGLFSPDSLSRAAIHIQSMSIFSIDYVS